tara:strand:- start:23 stop:286 length:264 start_codon:yes stop_codon:yes gene_type:complete
MFNLPPLFVLGGWRMLDVKVSLDFFSHHLVNDPQLVTAVKRAHGRSVWSAMFSFSVKITLELRGNLVSGAGSLRLNVQRLDSPQLRL